MRVEKMTLKKIFIMTLTAFTFLVLTGALIVPFLTLYKIGISEGFYSLYSRLCVETSSKCFLMKGHLIPLCARCLGIYTGAFFTLVLYLEGIKIPKNLYYTLAVLGIGEIVLEYFSLIFPNNAVRFAAGVFAGLFFVICLLRLELKFKKDY